MVQTTTHLTNNDSFRDSTVHLTADELLTHLSLEAFDTQKSKSIDIQNNRLNDSSKKLKPNDSNISMIEFSNIYHEVANIATLRTQKIAQRYF